MSSLVSGNRSTEVEFLDFALPIDSKVSDFSHIEFNAIGGRWFEYKGENVPGYGEAFARVNVDGIEYFPMVIGYMISLDGKTLRLLTSDAYCGTQIDYYGGKREITHDSTNDPGVIL